MLLLTASRFFGASTARFMTVKQGARSHPPKNKRLGPMRAALRIEAVNNSELDKELSIELVVKYIETIHNLPTLGDKNL